MNRDMNMAYMNSRYAWLATVAVLAALSGCASDTSRAPSDVFDKRVEMISMRDGIRLNTEIYTPKDQSLDLPILISRTPYGLGHDADGFHSALGGTYADLVEDGYIFVFQDIRGRFESEGTFVMIRPPRDTSDPDAIDEGTDTYDAIDWLLENVPGHNGRVGMLGISYGGWLTVMGMLDPHPALAAASPQASPTDMFIGDDFLHNGAFRLAPSFGYSALMESGKTNMPFDFGEGDVYDWYLDLGPLSNANERYFHGQIPSWNDFMENSTYTEYWKRQAVTPYLTAVHMPTLNVAGWWDAEDFFGPMTIYETLEKLDTKDENFLVVGPWRHGGWAGDGSSLGAIEFPDEPSRYFREHIQAPFFAYYLKNEGSWDLDEALTYQTGANRWKEYASWPAVEGASTRNLYFHADGHLGFEAPTGSDGVDSYVSDPANPVPYMPRPIPPFWQGGSALWKVADQRFLEGRTDVLSWQTAPLEEDVVVAGRIIANLFASTTGTDADWVVKLIDVYPEEDSDPEMQGYQLMIADEVMRARFRNSFVEPEPVPANEVIEYRIDLNSRHHRFRRGHRIMVQVQSSWFPLIGRNPQTFVNIPDASEADYRTATQRIFRSAAHPSHVTVPVLQE